MRLPQNILTKTYTKPRIFLCEADKTKICQLETTNTSGAFKFNSYSELSFEVSRLYNDIITGETKVNPYYDKIEALRLIYLKDIGYFEIQTPELTSDGIKEAKNITAYSSEYALSQKYLEEFYINTGGIDSIEVLYAERTYGKANKDTVKPVTFYNPQCKELSLLHLVFDKIYGWDIGNVDPSLTTMSRTFEIDRQSVYDFLMNEVCTQFNCYIVFDTINNKVNFHAESLTQKFMGDGKINTFVLVPAIDTIGTVSVNGFKTTQYNYYPEKTTVTIGGKQETLKAGTLILAETPKDGAIVEVVDDLLSSWETDVFVTFDNLSQEIKITYDADDIKTQLTVSGADGLDIREVNMGQPYLVDLSYYCTPEWLGVDLYNAYKEYLIDYNAQQAEYSDNAEEINSIGAQILWHENRMSTDEDGIEAVRLNSNELVTGEKYFIREGDEPNYYYKEVTLSEDFNVNQVYYRFTNQGLHLTEEKVRHLYEALQAYFQEYFKAQKSNTSVKLSGDKTYYSLKDLKGNFSFKYTQGEITVDVGSLYSSMLTTLDGISNFISPTQMAKKDSNGNLIYKVDSTKDAEFIFACINRFLDEIWKQLGSYPLTYLYKSVYEKLKSTALEATWGDPDSEHYGKYFAVFLMVRSIDRAIAVRKKEIKALQDARQVEMDKNAVITARLDLYTYFTNKYGDQQAKQFMMRLSAFLREDEYTDDNFVYTGQESLAELYQLKQELKECGKIELSKLCQPKLQFSMSMANIYALPEFEPIINQFQLGRVIKVALRSDYIKQSRLLQVNINFDDFSDFSCDFGDLTNLKTQSDLHADLLAQAISAGKSVASNKSYWNKGSDTANAIDLRIQRGLLDAATSIKSMDATQGVEIDNYGIHLRKVDPETQAVDPEEGWITNNKFLYSSDNFQTVQSVFGKYTIDGEDYWGVLAKAVIAGYIEGSRIVGGDIYGGTIDIGNGNFVVDASGNVVMGGGNVINGYVTDEEFRAEIKNISDEKMYTIELTTLDSQTFRNKNQTATMTCTVYEWGRDVTAKLDKSAFEWKRHSNDTGADTSWNMLHKGIGNTLQITTADVNENANFSCWVTIPSITTDGEEQEGDGTNTEN